MGVIYKTTNTVNGKIYIGKDKHNDPKYLGSGLLLHRAIKKYGKNVFTKEIVEDVDDTYANEREKYWIAYYDSTNLDIGYNMTKGGSGGDTFSHKTEEMKTQTRQRMSFVGRGRPKSAEWKKKMSERVRGAGNPQYGVVHSQEYKDAMSVRCTGIKHTEESRRRKSISKMGDKNPMKYLKEREPEKYRQFVSKIKEKVSGGNNPRAIKIFKFNLEGVFIQQYDCLRYAVIDLFGKFNYKKTQQIREAAQTQKPVFGFLWSYVDTLKA